MFVLAIFLSVISSVILGQDNLRIIKPTRGRPWPLPSAERTSPKQMKIDPNMFKFHSTNHDCDMLQKAYQRYKKWAFPSHSMEHRSSNLIQVHEADEPLIHTLDVNVLSKCEQYPYLYMDEQYQLKICSPDDPKKTTLISNSVWGALRGLETFSQLVVPSDKDNLYEVNCTQILDSPRFAHRGMLLDTSRHFLPKDVIKANLDLMAMNKFNVFHWHIVDDQSFPYVSKAYPNLSKKGAWSEIHQYSYAVVQEVVEYARLRGIRVVVEFDTPGHTYSWGLGQAGLLTECYNKSGVPDGTYGPIDPSKEGNFEFLSTLFEEISQRFPDYYLHLGGDEVPFHCWESNPGIKEFMSKLNISDYAKLEEYYFSRLLKIIANLSSKKGYLVWEEVFDNGLQIAKDTVVHVWKYGGDTDTFYSELENVTKAGYQAILSSCWYLSYLKNPYGDDWHYLYNCEPLGFNGTEAEKRLVIGGEAAMWGEFVDKTNVIPRTWPRGSTVAERLWSPSHKTLDPVKAGPRLSEHRCRMLKRGYTVEPLGPSFCEGIL